jgi:hypothetical protein
LNIVYPRLASNLQHSCLVRDEPGRSIELDNMPELR